MHVPASVYSFAHTDSSVPGINAGFEDVVCPYDNALQVTTTSERNQRLVSESHGTTYRERPLDVTSQGGYVGEMGAYDSCVCSTRRCVD